MNKSFEINAINNSVRGILLTKLTSFIFVIIISLIFGRLMVAFIDFSTPGFRAVSVLKGTLIISILPLIFLTIFFVCTPISEVFAFLLYKLGLRPTTTEQEKFVEKEKKRLTDEIQKNSDKISRLKENNLKLEKELKDLN